MQHEPTKTGGFHLFPFGTQLPKSLYPSSTWSSRPSNQNRCHGQLWVALRADGLDQKEAPTVCLAKETPFLWVATVVSCLVKWFPVVVWLHLGLLRLISLLRFNNLAGVKIYVHLACDPSMPSADITERCSNGKDNCGGCPWFSHRKETPWSVCESCKPMWDQSRQIENHFICGTK